MPFRTEWYDSQKTIIMVTVEGVVEWSELHTANDTLVQMAQSVSHRVDIIFDSQAGLPPGNPLPHFKVTGTKLIAVDNIGLIVSVSAQRVSTILKTLIDIITRAYGMTTKQSGGYVTSIEEALTVINKSRAKDKNNILSQ